MDPIAIACGWLIGLGAGTGVIAFRSRKSGAEPRCVRCGADVRGVAWDDAPRCTCGRDLHQYGAVRTGRRATRWRWMAIGFALLGSGIGLSITDRVLTADGRAFSTFAPSWLMRQAAAPNAPAWSRTAVMAEAISRAERDELDPELAADLVMLELSGQRWNANAPYGLPLMMVGLYTVPADRRDVHSSVAAYVDLALDTSRTPVPRGGGKAPIRLVLGQQAKYGEIDSGRFVRIESVHVNGQPAAWRIPGQGPFRSPDETGPLPIVPMPVTLECLVPTSVVNGSATLTVLATAGLFRATEALAHDPLANGTRRSLDPKRPLAPPWEWGVSAFGDQISVVVPVQVEGNER